MAVTNFTPLLGLALPTTGDLSGTWGATVNTAITDLLDDAVAGTVTLSADADVTLTTTNGADNQARNAVILWTASNGATTRNITAPAQSKAYVVINAGTGSVVIRGSGPTTGVTVVSGEKCLVAWNGSDFVKISTTEVDGVSTISFGTTGLTPSTATSGAVTVAGTLAVANGGTGATTAPNALTNLAAAGTGISNTFTANQIISVTDNTNAALRITQLGTGNALLVEDSTNPDASPFVIDNGGNVIVGYTLNVPTQNFGGTAITPTFQNHGTTASASSNGLFNWATSASTTATLAFSKSISGTIGTRGALTTSGTALGGIAFTGDDGTSFIPGAAISANVDGTPGTNDMPGRLVFSTTADGASSPTERMRIDSAGQVGIPGIVAGANLRVNKNLTGATATFGVVSSGTTQSDSTSEARMYSSTVSTAAAAFTLPTAANYVAVQGTIGAGSIVNAQYGINVSNTLSGATNNYGFYGNIAAPTAGITTAGTISTISSSGTTVTISHNAITYTNGQTVTISATANATALVSGATATILTVGTTDYTLIGAASNTVGVSFTATGAGTGDGTVRLNVQGSGKTVAGAASGSFTYTTTTSQTFAAVTVLTGTVTVSTRYNLYMNGTAENYLGGATTINTSSTTDALKITQLGTGNALLIEDDTNPDASPFVIDAIGKVIVGNIAYITPVTGITPQIQVQGNNASTSSITAARFSADSNSSNYLFSKSRNTAVGTYGGIVSSGDILGNISFVADDGANPILSAQIQAAVDGTPGTNDMPGRLVFATTADGASSVTERMRIDSAGNVGIGGTASSDTKFQLLGTYPTSGTNTFVQQLSGTSPSGTTNVLSGYRARLNTQAASFVLSNVRIFDSGQGAIGATSSIASQYGYFADASLTGATSNYGFYGNIASAANRYNLYMQGTAANYFNGDLTVYGGTAIPAGGTTGSGYKLSSTANFGVFFGSGAPTLSAAKGSLYLRSDGTTVNDRMYVNTNGSTTWTAVTTAA